MTLRDTFMPLAEAAAMAWHGYTARRALDDAVDEFGRDVALMKKTRPLFNFLYETYWRVRTTGVRHVPSKGRALIVANHAGTLAYDGAMIHMAVYREQAAHRLSRFLVEDIIQYLPFLGTFFNRVGGVRACQENAERILAQGDLLTVFPEGVKGIGKLFKDRYQLARFGRGGIVRLALKTRTPVIPCAVIGSEEIHPILWKSRPLAQLFGLPFIPITPTFPLLGPLGLIPLPAQWLISFGTPIRFDKMPAAILNDPLKLHTLTEELRQTIQRMVDDGLTKRATRSTAAARGPVASRARRPAG